MNEQRKPGGFTIAYTAETPAEALVIRSLLESAGIHSPGPEMVNPLELPLPVGPCLNRLLDIIVAEPKLEEARKLIEEYTAGNSGDRSCGSSSDNPDEQ